MNTDSIQHLRDLLAKATPVPWIADEWYCNDGGWAAVGPHHNKDRDFEDDGPDSECHNRAMADAMLIAAAVNSLPALLDEVGQLRASNEALSEDNCKMRQELARMTTEAQQRAVCYSVAARMVDELLDEIGKANECLRSISRVVASRSS